MRTLLHTFIASMCIMGLPSSFGSEMVKTQEISYHFTALCSFLILFKTKFSRKGIFPCISFEFRKKNPNPDKTFDYLEARYNINLIIFTFVGSFCYRVNPIHTVYRKPAQSIPRKLWRQFDNGSTAMAATDLHFQSPHSDLA